jgi:hypothetical protein
MAGRGQYSWQEHSEFRSMDNVFASKYGIPMIGGQTNSQSAKYIAGLAD